MAILALDQGTSGTKAVVVNDDGAILASALVELRPDYLGGDAVEQHPDALWASVLESGQRAIEEARVPIDAVALANQGETVLAWDPATGAPLTPALVWQDGRSASVCAELTAYADLIEARTGLTLDPYFSAPKQAWIRRHWTTEGVVTTTDAWLLHRLTGRSVTDPTTASRSLVFDLAAGTWDPELVAAFGLPESACPPVVANDEIVGETNAFELPPGMGGRAALPVAGIVVDQQAALFAQGCLEVGQAKTTFGTGAFVLAQTGDTPVLTSRGLSASAAWTLRGHPSYCLDGQVYTAASAVRWLVGLGVISSAADLDHVATDSAGVLCVPAFAGLAAPVWQADARASFVGLGLASDRGALVAALVEGLAASVAELCALVALQTGVPLDRLRVDGGLTRSRRLMQATADLLQRPVEIFPSPDATALGAAAMARLALRPELTPAEVVGRSSGTVVEPAWSPDRAADFLSRWRLAAQHSVALGSGVERADG